MFCAKKVIPLNSWEIDYPKFYPLQGGNLFDKGFHAVLGFLAHGVGNRCVSVHREGAGIVAQLLLNSLDAVTRLQSVDGVAVAQIVETGAFRFWFPQGI